MLFRSDVYERAKLMFGEDVAGQLKASFKEAGGNIIEDNVNKAMKKLATSSRIDKFGNGTQWVVDTARDLWYTLILNADVRFHGGNLLGAPALVYATTGRVLDPVDIAKSMETWAKAGGKAGNEIALTDKLGRSYSYNELDRKSTRLNSSHTDISRMPSSA